MTIHDKHAIFEVGLIEADGMARARDLEIAERLGFSRPNDIRKLIQRNLKEIEALGSLLRRGVMIEIGKGATREFQEYWLNEEQSLLVASLSNAKHAPAVRAMLIKVFVAWRKGRLGSVELPPELLEQIRRTDGICRMLSHKVTEVERSVAELAPAMIAQLVQAELAKHSFSIRHGKTSGQIWKSYNLHRIKGAAVWFGNRLAEMGCAIENGGMGELGLTAARLFDPDKAAICMRNGLLMAAERYVAERAGQRKLHLVFPAKKPSSGAA